MPFAGKTLLDLLVSILGIVQRQERPFLLLLPFPTIYLFSNVKTF